VNTTEITTLLNQNPSKRQNVSFLKGLLDQQLNELCNNLKVMQNDNAEIEQETISRLQLIEKFGQDANNGLELAKKQNAKLLKDLAEQKSQHTNIIGEQDKQQMNLNSELTMLETELGKLQTKFAQQQKTHQTILLAKQE